MPKLHKQQKIYQRGRARPRSISKPNKVVTIIEWICQSITYPIQSDDEVENKEIEF